MPIRLVHRDNFVPVADHRGPSLIFLCRYFTFTSLGDFPFCTLGSILEMDHPLGILLEVK